MQKTGAFVLFLLVIGGNIYWGNTE
jgi:hypothetical protein